MPLTEVSTRVSGLSAYENMDICPLDFATCGTPNPRYTLETSFHHLEPWGDLRFPPNFGRRWEIWKKFFWGSVADIFRGKVTGAFQKKSKQLGCNGEKTGLGVNCPTPLAIGGQPAVLPQLVSGRFCPALNWTNRQADYIIGIDGVYLSVGWSAGLHKKKLPWADFAEILTEG